MFLCPKANSVPRGVFTSTEKWENLVPGYLLRRGQLVLLITSPEQVQKIREILGIELIVPNMHIKRMDVCTDLV